MHRQSLFSTHEYKQHTPTEATKKALAEPLLGGTEASARDHYRKLDNYIDKLAYSLFVSDPQKHEELIAAQLSLIDLKAKADSLEHYFLVEKDKRLDLNKNVILILDSLDPLFSLLPYLAGLRIAARRLGLARYLDIFMFVSQLLHTSLAEVIALCPSQRLASVVAKIKPHAEAGTPSLTAAEIKPQAEAGAPGLTDADRMRVFFTHNIDALELQDIVSLQTPLGRFLFSIQRIYNGVAEHVNNPSKLLRDTVDELDAERIGHGSFGGAIFAPHPHGQNGRRAPNPRQLILEYLIERDEGEEIAREASVSATPPSPNRRCVVS